MDDLVAATEAVEALALMDLVEAAPPEAVRAAGLVVEEAGRARIVSATALDSILFNRAIGLDGGDLVLLSRAVRHYHSRGVRRFFLQLGPAAREPPVTDLLRSHGIERQRMAWHKLARSALVPLPAPASDLAIRRARASDAAACGSLVAAGLGAGELAAPLFAAVIGRPRWHVFAALAAGSDDPVAFGALFVHGELGHLTFAATDPGHRGRGAQRALIARRSAEAVALGCRWLVTETGEPLPGQPSPSHRNLLRSGFAIALRRDNYAPIGPAAP
jgi:ribosomal protein S18 acetylase RimI-like enzyme